MNGEGRILVYIFDKYNTTHAYFHMPSHHSSPGLEIISERALGPGAPLNGKKMQFGKTRCNVSLDMSTLIFRIYVPPNLGRLFC